MRLSRAAWLILGIGVFVIAFGSLYMVYSRQGNEQEQLNDSLSVAQATLPKLVSEKEDWERQLTQLKSQLARATSLLAKGKKDFPESVESIEYDERLFKIADDWGLEITSLTASESSDKKVEGITFSVTLFEVAVKGEVTDMLDFINTIATDEDFLNATVEVVNMVVPQPLTEEEKEGLTEEEIEEKEKSSATINLVIYGYRGQ